MEQIFRMKQESKCMVILKNFLIVMEIREKNSLQVDWKNNRMFRMKPQMEKMNRM